MGSDFVGLVGILDVLVVSMAMLMILLCCVDVVFHCVDDFALLCLCCSYAVVLMILLCCVCQIFLLNKCLRVGKNGRDLSIKLRILPFCNNFTTMLRC